MKRHYSHGLRRGLQAAALGVMASFGATQAMAATSGPTFVYQASKHNFGQTITDLKHAVSSNGMMVMGQINQAQVLKMTGLHLQGAHSFLVGNPVVGKKFFSMTPAVGAVIPLRVLVWEQSGHTYVGYFTPSSLLSAISAKLAGPGKMMDKKFSAVLQGATK